MSDNIVQLSDHLSSEKLVPCPACSGNGYTITGDPEVEGPSVDQCEMCDSQGEVEESYAKDWPFK
jgi:DnaJ-class molecular chaperone